MCTYVDLFGKNMFYTNTTENIKGHYRCGQKKKSNISNTKLEERKALFESNHLLAVNSSQKFFSKGRKTDLQVWQRT